MTNRVGQEIGHYRLVRFLGEGGFAMVYLGQHRYLGTQAAIKVLSTRLAQEDVKQFSNEARFIAHLKHPHIIRVLDFGLDDGAAPFLVMEYAVGGTLRQRHPRGSRLPLSLVVSYVSQIADALQYAHSHKLIHRDIKPENMLVGEQQEVLLSDFGIALVSQSSRMESVQEIAGTASYMAPEQFNGRPKLASDQYALAVVVYEWLSGVRPFQGSFAEVASQHFFKTPSSLCAQLPGLPPAVEQVVFRALAKDPEKRFASVREFAQALEAASLPVTSPSNVIYTPPPVSAISLDQSGYSPYGTASPADVTLPLTTPAPVSPITQPQYGKRRRGLIAAIVIALVSLLIASTVVYNLVAGGFVITSTIQRPVTPASTPPTITPLPYPPSGWRLALSDPLNTQANWHNGSFAAYGGACQFSNGVLHITQSKAGTDYCPTPTLSYGDFVFEVELSIITGQCGGLTFRGTTPSTYNFNICSDGNYYLALWLANGNTIMLVNDSSSAINTGLNQSNLIAVEAVGSHINLYINHRKVKGIDDTTGSSNGAINLTVSTDGASTDVAFTNAKVWTQ
ncbi:MAG TPA: serine/threonine-protein kinase [Ktedonosporobacter sp.]|nr:serine/threonine-protein kinase [Ktedonosporobacter sp.]